MQKIKKELALPIMDIMHLMQVMETSVMGAWLMQLPMEFKVSINGDQLGFTILAEVTEEEAAELDRFEAEAKRLVREQMAQRDGMITATVN